MSKIIGYTISPELSEMVVPASLLDNVIGRNDEIYNIMLHSYLTGDLLWKNGRCEENSYRNFINEARSNIVNKKYPTTDHLITVIEITKGEYALCCSLDNTTRVNKNGHSLINRISNICNVLKNVMLQNEGGYTLYFTESYRPSFKGCNLENATEIMEWNDVVKIIESECDVMYVGGDKNNDGRMSFGISCFVKNTSVPKLKTMRLVDTSHSTANNVALYNETNNYIVTHFPLDFSNLGPDNLGKISTENLLNFMTQKNVNFAFGDLNTVPGCIDQHIRSVLSNYDNYEFKINNILTFFGSYLDMIPVDSDGIERKVL